MSILSFLGTAAAGVNAATGESERLFKEAMAESERLRAVATSKASALQKVGQSYVDSGNMAAAGKLMPEFTKSFNQAYGTDLSTAPIVGSPVMKQGGEKMEQLGPAMPGKLMPRVDVPAPYQYDTGERTFGPESEAAIRGGLLLPKVKPETFELSAGQTRYEQLPGQAPKAVASLDPRPAKDAATRYDVDPVTGEVKAVVPGTIFGVKPDKADKDTSTKDYNRAYAEWQQRGASYVNDYVSLMARNSQRTRVQNGVTMTVPPSPEQMKVWRDEGAKAWRSQVNPPAPPGGSASTYPFGNPNPPSSGKAGGGTARWASQIAAASKATGVPAEIITAVMRQESGGNPNARSPVGAIGLMQFMPGTAAGMGINPADPDQAVLAGAKYLKANYDKFGSWKKAIAAYNAGPGAVQKYGGIPPYKETQGYVQRITNDLKSQGIEISSADATKAASLYEKYGITPGASSSANVEDPARPAMREVGPAPVSPVRPGNIDTTRRPKVKNADGSISTVRSIGVTFDDGTYLLPTVVGNRVVSNKEAIAHFRKTGQHLGIFKTPAESNAYAEWLHREQEQRYTAPSLKRPKE